MAAPIERVERFRHRLKDQTLTGVRCIHAYPAILETIARSPVDFIYLDQQHGTVDVHDIVLTCALLRSHDTVVLVRPTEATADHIGRALDAGADGVLVPNMESAAGVSAAVAATHFPPKGVRSWGSFALTDAGDASVLTTFRPIVIPLLESSAALAQVEAILDVDGIDALYIGRNDLAYSLGSARHDQGGGPVLDAAIGSVLTAATARGVAVGTSGNLKQLADAGFRLLTIPSELALLAAGLDRVLDR